MKKALAIVLVLVFALSMVACQQAAEPAATAEPAAATAEPAATTAEPAATVEPTTAA